MPKIKDFFPIVELIVTKANPVVGIGLKVIQAFFHKPKEKAKVMLEGKKTYVGIAVALIPTVAKLFGYDVGASFTEDATNIINDVIVLVGGAIALYGRAVTTGKGLFVK